MHFAYSLEKKNYQKIAKTRVILITNPLHLATLQKLLLNPWTRKKSFMNKTAKTRIIKNRKQFLGQ